MKTIKLIAIIFLTLIRVFVFGKDLVSSKLSFSFDGKNDEIAGGLKLKIPYAEGCYFQKNNNQNFAGNLFSEKLLTPFEISLKAGNYYYSGILSKLNNPLISSVNAFSSPSVLAQQLTISMPGFSSFTNSVNYCVTANYSGKQKNFLQTLNVSSVYFPDEKLFYNLFIKFRKNKNYFYFSQIAGLFQLNNSTISSWYKENNTESINNYFHSGKYFSNLTQIGFNNKKIYSLLSFQFYQSPFGNFDFIFKTENKMIYNRNNFNFSMVFNSNRIPVLTSSSKKIGDCLQSRFGFQHQFSSFSNFPFFVKIGINNYINSNFYYKTTDGFLQETKQSFGVQLISNQYRFISTLQTDEDFKLLTKDKIIFNGFNLMIKNYCYFENISPVISATFSYKILQNSRTIQTGEKFSASVVILKNPNVTTGANFKFSQKDYSFDSFEWNISVTVKFFVKNLTVQLKATDYF